MDSGRPDSVRGDMAPKCPIVDADAILRASWLTHLPHEEAVEMFADEGWPLAIADLIVTAGRMLDAAREQAPASVAQSSK